MKQHRQQKYLVPEIKVHSVCVEKGFFNTVKGAANGNAAGTSSNPDWTTTTPTNGWD